MKKFLISKEEDQNSQIPDSEIINKDDTDLVEIKRIQNNNTNQI